MNKILEYFKFGKIEEKNFRYCGKEVVQADDFTITVSCKATAVKVEPIKIQPGRKLSDPLNEAERTQLRSVAGMLCWVARQCRPDLSYRVSKMQTAVSKGKVRDLKEANKVVEYALNTADKGIVFRSGILDWNTMVLGNVCDASHANESTDSGEPHRSQGARMHILATPELKDGSSCHFHLIGWASNVFAGLRYKRKHIPCNMVLKKATVYVLLLLTQGAC